MFYTNSKEAFSELKNHKIEGEKRFFALNYVFLCAECSYMFVKKNLYQSEDELRSAINRISKNSCYSAKILISCENKLTEKEKEKILESALDSWDSAYLLLKSYRLNKINRKLALNMIMMSVEHVKKFLQCCKHTVSERLQILSAFGNNLDVLQIFIKCVNQGVERQLAFETLLNNPDEIYVAAYNNRLLTSELKTVYSLYSNYYYNKFKRKFQCYRTYCCTFSGMLSKQEEELMVKKLRSIKHYDVVPFVLSEINFTSIDPEVLQSIIIANKLLCKNKQI